MENIQQIDKEHLWQALREGDEAIFEAVFKEYYPPLVNYASRIVYNAEVAKDVVQDIFYRLWDSREQLCIRISLKAYLFKVVYTACIDFLRHKKVEEGFANKALQDFYFEQIIQAPEAELKLFESEVSDIIVQSLDCLPEKCREIFVMTKLEGKSNPEAARALGISPKTVEAQITIAYARLRKELSWLLHVLLFSL